MAEKTSVAVSKDGKAIAGSQTIEIALQGDLTQPLPKGWDTYRTIRAHPTICLARGLAMAPVLGATWNYEKKGDGTQEMVDFIRSEMACHRFSLLETGMEGTIDFGWQALEIIYKLRSDGLIGIRKAKPLLHDITTLSVDVRTGQLVGVTQANPDGTDNDIEIEQLLILYMRVEGTNWYGRSLLEGARTHHDDWVEANKGAKRYDKKMAGSHWVVKYPIGSTEYKGSETANSVIAGDILAALESSGSVTIPKKVPDELEDVDVAVLIACGWEIDLVSDAAARQYSFVARLDYLDKMLVRSLLIPERAVLEGKAGTKAEAGAHADFAITFMDLQHRSLTGLVNWHLVDRLLALNFGEETRGMVEIVTSPLADQQLSFMREVYLAMLRDPNVVLNEMGNLNLEAVREGLGIPQNDEQSIIGIDGAGEEGLNVEDDETDTEDIAIESAAA